MDEFEPSSNSAEPTLWIQRTPRARPAPYPAPGLVPGPGTVRSHALTVLAVPLLLILLLALHPWSWGSGSPATDTGYGSAPGSYYGGPAPSDTTDGYSPTATTDPYATPTDDATPTDLYDPATDTATASASATSGPAATVTSYFAAINSQDYETAWSLGGKNLDSDYADFVAGFADTQQDAVTIVSVQGDVVSVDLVSTQTDESQQSYSGTYTVVDNVITAAQMQQTG